MYSCYTVTGYRLPYISMNYPKTVLDAVALKQGKMVCCRSRAAEKLKITSADFIFQF